MGQVQAMDTIGRCFLNCDQQIARASSKATQDSPWSKDTKAHKHPICTYRGIILTRENPRAEPGIEHLDQ